jgi:hypothetical protein
VDAARADNNMKSQIYIPQSTRGIFIKQINDFCKPYYQKLIPQFKNIDKEAETIEHDYYERMGKLSNYSEDEIDPSELAETAHDHGLDHFMTMILGKYTVTAAYHATLFELFHQQLRLFLFDEMNHYVKNEIGSFCTEFSEIKDIYAFHNYDVTRLIWWNKIEELRLLCNVIKHGDGVSANKLRQTKPDIFRKFDGVDLFDLYKTTLLEITLNIDDSSFERYQNAVIGFWFDIPERLYSNERCT